MRVLFVSSEVYPLIKTGGLGDVAGALPAALMRLGIEVRILAPAYPAAVAALGEISAVHDLGDVLSSGPTRLLDGWMPDSGVGVWLIDNPALFNRPGGPYQRPDGHDHEDNFRRFAVLSRVAASLGEGTALPGWNADVIHANDWQTGLVAAYLKADGRSHPATVFTIHNLHFQGNFDRDILPLIGLPEWTFFIQGLEFYGNASYLKAGLFYADRLTTVSPTYAWEITTPEGGRGLEGLLDERQRSGHLSGILNGVDYNLWDPRHDGTLPQPYGPETAATGKLACKQAFQEEIGLAIDGKAPLFAAVSRFSDQKGLDLVIAGADHIVQHGGQLILLGTGDPALEQAARDATARHPGRVACVIGYEEEISHRIQAAADIFLVPSRFEPCGLTQLYALRYGALPLVRRTGGLADTVVDMADGEHGTGFVFEEASLSAFTDCCDRALHTWFHDQTRWTQLRWRAMAQDFGWERAATAYVSLYREALAG